MWFSPSSGGDECVWIALLIQQLLRCVCVCVCVDVCVRLGARAARVYVYVRAWSSACGRVWQEEGWLLKCDPHTAVFTLRNRAHTPLCVASMPAEVNEVSACVAFPAARWCLCVFCSSGCQGWVGIASHRLLWICLRCSFTHVARSHVNTEGWCGMCALVLIPQGYCVLAHLTVRFKLWCPAGCGATTKNAQLRGALAYADPGEAARRSVMHVSYLGLWQRIRCARATHWHRAEMRWDVVHEMDDGP